jgi:hypothetical protein
MPLNGAPELVLITWWTRDLLIWEQHLYHLREYLLQKPMVLKTDCEDGGKIFFHNLNNLFTRMWLQGIITQKVTLSVFYCVSISKILKEKYFMEEFLIEN